MFLRAAIELHVFNIIADAGLDAHLSAAQITSKIPTTHPNSAAHTLEIILRFFGAHSILSISRKPLGITERNARHEWTYGLTKQSRCLVSSNNTSVTTSQASIMIRFSREREIVDSLLRIKDAVVGPGGAPFNKAHGMSVYDYVEKKPILRQMLDELMEVHEKSVFDDVFKMYGGFEVVRELMDVGGSIGTTCSKIISLYPHIRRLFNFDLAQVIADAPTVPVVS